MTARATGLAVNRCFGTVEIVDPSRKMKAHVLCIKQNARPKLKCRAWLRTSNVLLMNAGTINE